MSFTSFDAPGAGTGAFQGTHANAINDSGVITGGYTDSSGKSHGYVRAVDGTITTFDSPSSILGTVALCINSSGRIAGTYLNAAGNAHIFVRDADGTFHEDEPTSSGDSRIGGINDSGVVAGWYTVLGDIKGFIRTGVGAFTDILPPSGFAFVSVVGIDNSGNVAGIVTEDSSGLSYGFIYDGTMTLFLDSGTDIFPAGIAGGVIVGTSTATDPDENGFMRDAGGTITDFDVPASTDGTAAQAVNAAGQITGIYFDADGTHGYLRLSGGAFETFDVTGGFGNTRPLAINGSGVVSGYYIDSSEIVHAFFGTPDGAGPPPSPPALRYKLIPMMLDFANTTWDQANRLAMYELYRSLALDPSDPFLQSLFEGLGSQLWDPPKTLTIQVFADAVDDSWNILKRPLDGSGNVTPLQGKRITIDPSVDEEWAGDWEVVRASYKAFQPSNAASGGGDPSMPSGVAGIARPNDQSGGTITLTLRSYDERWLSLDTSQTPSYLNLELPIHDDELG
jgi:uncharacterized membrane protein